MRTRAALGSIFGSVAVLVIGWQAGSAAAHNAEAASSAPSSTATNSASSSSTTTPSATPTPSASTNSSSSTTKTATTTKTYTGAASNTQYGPVQVKITVTAGKITGVTALQLTNRDGRSAQISNYAAPILRQEVLAAQSAKVSTVGGATYTSDGYLTSLQSALDQAGL